MMLPELLLACLSAVPGHPLTVAVLRPRTPSPIIAEAVMRLRGELASEGLATAWLDEREGGSAKARTRTEGVSPRAQEPPLSLGALAGARGLDAAVALNTSGRGHGFTVEVWVVDKAKGRSLSRELPVEVEGDPTAKLLAIRAAELLRSSLVELDLVSTHDVTDKEVAERETATPAAPPPTTATATATTTTPAPSVAEVPGAPYALPAADAPTPGTATATATATAPSRDAAATGAASRATTREALVVTRDADQPTPPLARLGVAVGGAASTSFDGASSTLDPMLHLVWPFSAPWALALCGAGGGAHATVSGPAGSAKLSQAFVVAGLERALGAWPSREAGGASTSGWTLAPFLALSAGALRTFVEGEANAPYQASEASRWSVLFDGSVGARLGWQNRLFVEAVGRVQMAAPYPSVRFDGHEVATTARPNLGFALALGAWL